jgi:hypothetical protein
MRKGHTGRSKKYGGAKTVFVCESASTLNEDCIKAFESEKGFIWKNVDADGNCFFHTLALYYDNKKLDKELHKKLRKDVVDYMLTHFDEYKPFGITREDIESLYTICSWNNKAGDFVVPAAAAALNLKIKLYDLTEKQIILHTYPEDGIKRKTVNIIRINNHFGLLKRIPKMAPADPDSSPADPAAIVNKLKILRLQLEAASQPKEAASQPKEAARINQFKKLQINLAKHIKKPTNEDPS